MLKITILAVFLVVQISLTKADWKADGMSEQNWKYGFPKKLSKMFVKLNKRVIGLEVHWYQVLLPKWVSERNQWEKNEKFVTEMH